MINLNKYSTCYYRSGEFARSESELTLPVINPFDQAQLAEIASCTQEEVDGVIEEANVAQRVWAKVDAKTRSAYLHQIADAIEQADHREVAEAMVLEMGKPYPEALGEIANIPGAFRYLAEMARDEGGYIAGTTQAGSFQYCRYEPLGVSVHIMPFNFPLLLMAWTVAASLASGNAVIIKPSEATSICTLLFMKHFEQLPKGLVHCVTGNHTVGNQLVSSNKTHAVAFTGSVAVGKMVNVACAEQMKPAVIEAGGNDAFIVSASAPIKMAAAAAVTAAFHLSGQVCTSAERFFVAESVHDEFVAEFVALTKQLRLGSGFDRAELGPVVNKAAQQRILKLIGQAQEEGATLALGGGIPEGLGDGAFVEPTILTNVSPQMQVMNSEVFGPVAAICKVADVAQAIELANNSDFGLGASIITTDMREAQMASEELVSGMVWINNPLIDNDALPFGGRKLSGVGRELGREGLNTFRASKMVIQDADPVIQDWWYPYSDDAFYPHGND
ncbi:aldehyde dehydrogenase family protein [Umboniibacter marinipuniceus]|uniref:Acyl-CoA reductase-like NAD-dependent aldehyde dehydrogenase n=1 Tax=Umboniibacter marinipuniceus TaxID=569599 RepID=A0A3L9ZZQ8_9GAMM|nr:aldehyde dehydrogenase family protein [Umboniibacter marinipuniceus]RMA77614.1 acyl-CoA reductase-like NAD-dependent aldehyde dehydrogenase [Umboniibacter marinipuniceus]